MGTVGLDVEDGIDELTVGPWMCVRRISFPLFMDNHA